MAKDYPLVRRNIRLHDGRLNKLNLVPDIYGGSFFDYIIGINERLRIMDTMEQVELMESVKANYCFKHKIPLSQLKNHPEATAELTKAYIKAIKA